MADSGVDTLSINSPRGLSRALLAAREFLYRFHIIFLLLFASSQNRSLFFRNWSITLHEFGLRSADEYVVLQDANVTISAVPFALVSSTASIESSTTTTTCRHKVQMFPSQFVALRTSNCVCTQRRPDCAESVVYVIKCADMPGKFDATKARALGIEGPLRGSTIENNIAVQLIRRRRFVALLVKGQTVKNADGVDVTPADCISAPTPGRVSYYLNVIIIIVFFSTTKVLDFDHLSRFNTGASSSIAFAGTSAVSNRWCRFR